MSQLEYHARITWDDDTIFVDAQLLGFPPQHHELAWSLIESWGVGRPDDGSPEGIYLLLKEIPHCEFMAARAAGSVALEGELRARGFPEVSAAAVVTEARHRNA